MAPKIPIAIPMTVSDPTLDVHAFLVMHWEGEPVNAAPEEHDDLRWFRPGDLAVLALAHPPSLRAVHHPREGGHHPNFVHWPSETTSTDPSTTLMAVCSSMA